MLKELCLADWLQNLQDALLHQSVLDGRNAERPRPSIQFGYFYPPYPLGKVIVQLVTNHRYQFLRMQAGKICDGLSVNSLGMTSLVFLDISVGQQDVLFLADEFHKITKTSAIAAFRIEVIKNCLKVVVFIVP